MEKLNDFKFQQLTPKKMQALEGGWRWKTVSISRDWFVDEYVTTVVFKRENIFGKVVDSRSTHLSDN